MVLISKELSFVFMVLSSAFAPMTKNYHYSDKILSHL